MKIMLDSDEICVPPEVCGDNAQQSKREHLLSQTTTGEHNSRVDEFLQRDKPLIIAIVAMVVFMNFRTLGHILYPFQVFSTWIHELSHGMAAILVGGGISKLLIYPDTSGLAWTVTNGSSFSRGIVASAGYTGTAVLGMVLLLFRRTYRGPTVGTISIGVLMLLSCLLYVRNTFALVFLPVMAISFILCAWKLKAKHLTYLYSFLAATCSFNALDNIWELYGPVGYVNGEEVTSDAHAVAEYWGGTYATWATWWLLFSLACSAIGLLFAFDGTTYKQGQKGAAAGTGDVELPRENNIVSSNAVAVPVGAPISIYDPSPPPDRRHELINRCMQ